ncbi:MAG TPA: SRPBCC domain-containing protein [Candidatus Sulfotelmatobacter sp.]|nr:SRPBCC domain-containing protein [Candidatus Sulfotelmatobacter sp.]
MSNTATMRVSNDQDEITSEIEIAVPRERVFQALVDPQQVLLWWGQTGIYRCTEFQSELRPGGKWRSAGIGPEGRPFQVAGEYLEVAPPRLLVHTWIASWTGDAKTTVRWELHTTATGTLLRLRHSGLAAHPGIGDSYRGWPRMLGWIQALLEKGETVQHRKAS